MNAAIIGFFTGISLILPIGIQNVFVLKQGLLRHHIFWVCLFCALSDALLIAFGVLGFGIVMEEFPLLPKIMRYAGAVFLFIYGYRLLKSAIIGNIKIAEIATVPSLKVTLLTCLALTWLNPHVYLDTFGLIGAISTQFIGTDKTAFALGAITASFVFFFALGYGARFLSPIMSSSKSWQILDAIVGTFMWGLALSLLISP